MTIKDLQQKLLEAYTVNNLNRISLTLINLYKNKQYAKLQKIASVISSFTAIEIASDGKGFSKFMMLYHPDKMLYHINEINRLTASEDFDGLLDYSHILKLERIEEIATSPDSYEDIDYSPVYDWDINTEGFSIINDSVTMRNVETKPSNFTFYDAIKIREYGHTDIEFPPYYLEDFDDFELSSSGINDLDGVQFCIHAKIIDLSDNQITDISLLEGLALLEELNLSDNQIGYIDVMSNLLHLKSLQLVNNYIEDVSPLFELEKLEYVNLSGNNISSEQINELVELGITVDF